MNTPLNIVLFTADYAFSEILKRILEQSHLNYHMSVVRSFVDANQLSSKDKIHLILVDDLIIGTSSYELVAYIRQKKKVICPLIYFGTSEHQGEKKALMSGANCFINKPFAPTDVANCIKKQVEPKPPTS